MGEGGDKPFRSDTERTQIRQWEKGETSLSDQTPGERGDETFHVGRKEKKEAYYFRPDSGRFGRHNV